MVQDRGSGSQVMSSVSATLAVLLLVLDIALLSSAKFVVEDFSSGTQLRRGLSESKSEPRTVAVDLMHVQHLDSPDMRPNLTLLQRAQNAVKKSKQRLKYFSRKILGEKKTIGVNHVLSSPLFSEQSDYVMQISVGTPARKFLASIGTASDLIWLQCSPCLSCFTQPDPLFNPSASSSYTPLPCNGTFCKHVSSTRVCDAENTCLYEYNYADTSFTNGSMAYEVFSLTSTNGSEQAFSDVAFGCGFINVGYFGPSVDGVVGLGNGPLSLVSQLGASIERVFSYCLVDYFAATTTTSSLLLGSAGNISLTYTPLINNSFNPTFYYLNLTGITVAGLPVTYPSDYFTIDPATGIGGLVIDSGTTATNLFDAVYNEFAAAVDSKLLEYPLVTVDGMDLCYDTGTVNPVFPEIVFQFDGVDLAMPSENVFLQVDTQGILYCMMIFGAGPYEEVSVFGNVQQQNFQIAYDIANARVGFAPTTC